MQGLFPEIFEMFYKYLVPVKCSLVLSTLFTMAGTNLFLSLLILTIYAPMLYIAPFIMFWMRAYPLRGEVGRGWALEFESFLGPVKWHRANRLFYAHEPPGDFNGEFIGGAHSVVGGGAGE